MSQVWSSIIASFGRYRIKFYLRYIPEIKEMQAKKHQTAKWTVVATLLSIALACTPVDGEQGRTDLPVNLNGEAIEPLADVTTRAVVFFFVAVDCPISNRYAPVINSISKRYGTEDVTFWTVYPDGEVTAAAVLQHQKDYDLTLPALRDPGYFLVELAGAEVTPQVAVFIPTEDETPAVKLIYSGRIDDQYVAFGKWRNEPQQEDLKEVLEAIALGSLLKPRTTKAVGCYIAPWVSTN